MPAAAAATASSSASSVSASTSALSSLSSSSSSFSASAGHDSSGASMLLVPVVARADSLGIGSNGWGYAAQAGSQQQQMYHASQFQMSPHQPQASPTSMSSGLALGLAMGTGGPFGALFGGATPSHHHHQASATDALPAYAWGAPSLSAPSVGHASRAVSAESRRSSESYLSTSSVPRGISTTLSLTGSGGLASSSALPASTPALIGSNSLSGLVPFAPFANACSSSSSSVSSSIVMPPRNSSDPMQLQGGLWPFGRNTSASQPFDPVAAPVSLSSSLSLSAATNQFHHLQQQHQLQLQQHQQQTQLHQPGLPTIQISNEAAARASVLFGASQQISSAFSMPGLGNARNGPSPTPPVSALRPSLASERPLAAAACDDGSAAASRCDST